MAQPSDGIGSESARFARIGEEAGLAGGFVESITQDAQGFIWLGTQSGLSRYDGFAFRTYQKDPDNAGSLGDNTVNTLFSNDEGVWVGTQLSGLYFLPSGSTQFQHVALHPQADQYPGINDVRRIIADSNQNLWIATNNGLVKLTPDRQSTYYDSRAFGLSNVNIDVRDLAISRNVMWIATANHGAYQLNLRTHEIAPPLISGTALPNELKCLAVDPSGDVWIGAFEAGLYHIDGTTQLSTAYVHTPAMENGIASNSIRSLLADDEGNLWVGYQNHGLSRLTLAEHEFTHFHHQPESGHSLSNNRVSTIFQDRSGVLWVGTYQGANTWNVSLDGALSFSGQAGKRKLSSDVVTSFVEADNQGVWVGYADRGVDLVSLDDGRIRSFRHNPEDPNSLSDDRVFSLATDTDGTLWLGTMSAGLNRLSADHQTVERFLHKPDDTNSLSDNDIPALWSNHEGLWIATFGGGLNLYDSRADRFSRFRHDPDNPSSLSSDRLVDLFMDSEGVLWIATHGSGINRKVGDGFHRIQHDPSDPASLSSDASRILHEDASGNLWIGTADAGLNVWSREDRLLDRQQFTRLTTNDGLPSNVIYGITHDMYGDLWVTTAKGLARVELESGSIETFTHLHGLQGNDYNHRANYRMSDGVILVGGMNGFNAFKPRDLKVNPHPPQLAITEVRVMNKLVDWQAEMHDGGLLKFKHADPMITFGYAALEFTAPNLNTYEHRLLGFDDAWVHNQTSREATYTNLPAGRYEFQVRATNHDGVMSLKPLSMPILVSPPLWATNWAKMGYLLAILLVAYLVFHQIRSRMVSAEEIRLTNAALRKEIEARKQQQSAVRQLERRMHDAQKMEALGTLSRGVAHDFNNILSAIQGYTDLAKMDIAEQALAKEHLQQLEGSVSRARQLIQSILTFSKQAPQAPQNCDLNEIIEGVLQLVRPSLPANVEVRVNTRGSLLPVLADPSQLNQLLMNLCTNAYQAMGEKGGELTVTMEQRDVTLPGIDANTPMLSRKHIMLEVSDTGAGMDQDTMNRVFEPFFTTKDRTSGTGLGLSVVHGIVNQIGGTIAVRSDLGQGTTFSIALPCAQGDNQYALPAARQTEYGGGTETILIADDELSLVRISQNLLDRLGYQVLTATDGESALNIYQDNEGSIDLVITDQMMPFKLGTELAADIHQNNPELPVILMSGGGAEHAHNPDVFEFLEKPFTHIELAQIIRRTLDQQKLATS